MDDTGGTRDMDDTGGMGDDARADCVHCGDPTEYPADRPGVTLCPVCEWQEAQRTACSG
ncbi:hypothetical protein NKH77_39365 [Streptomyces sp. M19]